MGTLLAGCAEEASETTRASPSRDAPISWSAFGAPRRIILISIDTLRADRLGVYGHDADTSPRIDRFARESIVFRRAFAHAPSTLASHASLFTSLVPRHHGASFARRRALPASRVTLAERLREAGFRTAAFTGGGQLHRVFGLDQGFDVYEHIGEQYFLQPVRAGIRWLREQGDEPTFLFLHTYETHHPYEADFFLDRFETDYEGPLPDRIQVELLRDINDGLREIDDADRRHIRALYDAGIYSVDRSFAHLLRRLRQFDLYDDSLIILTSDHGEELGEHGTMGWHSHTLYDELLHVPLIMRLPGGAHGGSTVDSTVRSIDVAPTILQSLGLEAGASMDGASLLELLTSSRGSDRDVLSELDARSQLVSYRAQPWKAIGPSLFHVERDPEESTDLSPRHENVRLRLLSERDAWLASRPAPAAPSVTLGERSRAALEALGYIED